jgi:hypothetical protein
MDAEETCGAELARDAEVPEKLGRLMEHVAENLRAHAVWVGMSTEEARREHDALQHVASGYESIGEAAGRTAAAMRAMRSLPPAPHDASAFDRGAFVVWMREKIAMQRELARLLLEHAELSRMCCAANAWPVPSRPQPGCQLTLGLPRGWERALLARREGGRRAGPW